MNAANKYIRAGAAGTSTGDDWTNAYATFAAAGLDSSASTGARGNVYYVADGSYGSIESYGMILMNVESGTSTIEIRKATVADHGTSTGWSDTMGDGQSILNGVNIARDYYIFNGVSRNESNWEDTTAYGLSIGYIIEQNNNFPPGGDHIVIRYCNIGGAYSHTFTSGQGIPLYFFGIDGALTDITVSHCFIHNWSSILLAEVNNILIEYNLFAAGWGKEAIRGSGNCYNGIIRNNVFYNSTQFNPDDVTSGCTAEIGIWDNGNFDGWEIYGNVIYNDKVITHSDAVMFVGGPPGTGANNIKMYNNTIVGVSGQAVLRITGNTNTFVYNNLWYDCPDSTGVTIYPIGGGGAWTGANNIVQSSNPFVSYSHGSALSGINLRLSAALAGTTLGVGYSSTDLTGATRGSDGTWDRGAYEFGGSTLTGTMNLQRMDASTLHIGQ